MGNTEMFEMWYADKQCMVETMRRNMADDLKAGYDPDGACITSQRREINEYQSKFDTECDFLQAMDNTAAERWCYIDLKRRGAIE